MRSGTKPCMQSTFVEASSCADRLQLGSDESGRSTLAAMPAMACQAQACPTWCTATVAVTGPAPASSTSAAAHWPYPVAGALDAEGLQVVHHLKQVIHNPPPGIGKDRNIGNELPGPPAQGELVRHLPQAESAPDNPALHVQLHLVAPTWMRLTP